MWRRCAWSNDLQESGADVCFCVCLLYSCTVLTRVGGSATSIVSHDDGVSPSKVSYKRGLSTKTPLELNTNGHVAVIYTFVNSTPAAIGNLRFFIKHGMRPTWFVDVAVIVQVTNLSSGSCFPEHDNDAILWSSVQVCASRRMVHALLAEVQLQLANGGCKWQSVCTYIGRKHTWCS